MNEFLTRVGAPMVDAYTPLQGTASAQFNEWMLVRRSRIAERLDRLAERWSLLTAFVEVNFIHPDFGPSGAITLTASAFDLTAMRSRMARLMVIPFRELGEFISDWEKGRTVLISVDDMPEALARRYTATPIRWSLNVPVRIGGNWVGMVGAAAGEQGVSDDAVMAFETLAEVLRLEFVADNELWAFRRMTTAGNRFLRLLR